MCCKRNFTWPFSGLWLATLHMSFIMGRSSTRDQSDGSSSKASPRSRRTKRSAKSASSAGRRGPPCKFCLRGRTTPNPCPTRREGPFLSFLGDDRAECSSCRQFCRIFYKGVTGSKVAAQLAENKEKREKHLASLEEYEQYFEMYGNNKGVSGSVAAPDMEVTIETAAVLQSEMELGVFWPMEIYNATVDEKQKLRRSDCVVHMHNGKRHLGIIRETSHGVPRGCMRLADLGKTTVAKKQNIADTNTPGVGGKHVSETFEKVRGPFPRLSGRRSRRTPLVLRRTC